MNNWEDKSLDGKWQVEPSDASDILEFSSVGSLASAIIEGKVRPGDKARRIKDSEGKDVKLTDSKPILDTLAKSSFHLRVLFQPVWAHTVAGAGIATRIGVVVALLLCVFQFLQAEAYGISYWLTLITSLWCLPWISKLFGEQVNAGIWIGGGVACAVILSKLIPIWQSLPIALQVQLGATVAGALMGVFPGMVLGTSVGLLRRNRLRFSVFAAKEDRLLLKGIVIPLLCFIVVLIARHYFAEWFVTWMENQSM